MSSFLKAGEPAPEAVGEPASEYTPAPDPASQSQSAGCKPQMASPENQEATVYQPKQRLANGCVLDESQFADESSVDAEVDGVAIVQLWYNPSLYYDYLAFISAVEEINNSSELLPNLTLGFYLYNSYNVPFYMFWDAMDIFTGMNVCPLNYHCKTSGILAAIIEGLPPEESSQMSSMVRIYHYPQISFTSQSLYMSDKVNFPYFYRTVPNELHICAGIVKLLKHFDWTWVGIITTDDDSSLRAVQILREGIEQHGGCIAFIETFSHTQNNFMPAKKILKINESIHMPSIKVIIVYSNTDNTLYLNSEILFLDIPGKVWITKTELDFPSRLGSLHKKKNSTLSFAIANKKIPSFTKFIQELHHYLKKVHFKNNLEDEVFFNENGDLNVPYNIINMVYLPNGIIQHRIVGSYNPFQRQDFTINEKMIIWESTFNQTPPQATCTKRCPPGFRKLTREGEPVCCYDCVPCPEGEISSQSDMDNCVSCSEDQRPNHERNSCIPKLITFLSYEDSLGNALTISSIFFFLINAVILRIFITYRDTPIVRANNRDISFILLTSLMSCFLCSLMFIGRPQVTTCILRQAAFGIIFSISLSSILAKTVTVVTAFHATKPGSRFQKWMSSRVSFSIILSCFLLQVLICLVWLCTAPPFPYLNMHVDTGIIVVECNEGSAIAFYSLLGFLGFLAAISFIIAFLSRNLPDGFNEAKNITFSMLVFCSVWLTFIPAYLSTRGKYTVAVEIFAIQASSAGLLGCIFIPKCYIIILRPDMNSRKCLK
uniref:Vomeronasal type-2 receptor 26-like n=1 Tax=Geotrypetes seraphini TaxID=260995 RepID=A0A6P8P7U8_GEOSA|nr:vomeronasal type-2 receptor 26-like [Geotrypetes seraphini]